MKCVKELQIINDLFCFYDQDLDSIFINYYNKEKEDVLIKIFDLDKLVIERTINTEIIINEFYCLAKINKTNIENLKVSFSVNDITLEKSVLKNLGFKRYNSIVFEEIHDIIGDVETIIEIGSYQGESTILFSNFFPTSKVYAVDPWCNHYDPNDGSSEDFDMKDVEHNFDIITSNKNIIKIKDTSELFSQTIVDESIDLVYIDGNHRYEFIKLDIEKWLPKVKKNGYISGHDYFYYKETVGRAVDELLNKPDFITSDNWFKKKKYSENLKYYIDNKKYFL